MFWGRGWKPNPSAASRNFIEEHGAIFTWQRSLMISSRAVSCSRLLPPPIESAPPPDLTHAQRIWGEA